ncbi:MAG: hypothetical protein ACKVON_08065 [Beijerinckiaceae bacterium]
MNTIRHTHFIPLPTSAAGPMLAKAKQRMQKAEASHIGRGPARRSLIHLTARHLAFENAERKRLERVATTPNNPSTYLADLFGEAQ